MFKQRDTTTNSAWHSSEKGSLGSRGQTNFICPLGVFCCIWMATKDTIHLYWSLFLTIQGSQEVKPVTGCRCVMGSTWLFCKPSHRHAAWDWAVHQATCHATKDAFCTARPSEGKRLWLCDNLRDGKGSKVDQWSLPVLIRRNEHGLWHHRPSFGNEGCEILLKDSENLVPTCLGAEW